MLEIKPTLLKGFRLPLAKFDWFQCIDSNINLAPFKGI